MHLLRSILSSDSHIILILDSVPDFLTSSLPFPNMIFSAFLIANLHFFELILESTNTLNLNNKKPIDQYQLTS